MYFIIGLVIATIGLVYNWKAVTRVRKKVHEGYLRYQKAIDSKLQTTVDIRKILGHYTLCSFDVRPWAEDYVPLVIGAFLDVVTWPLWLIRYIKTGSFLYECVVYSKDGMKLE